MPFFFPFGGQGSNFGASSFKPIQPSFGFPDQYGSSVVGSMGGYGSGATPPFNNDEQGKALWQQLIAAYENAEKMKKWAQLDAAGEQIGTALSNGYSGTAKPTYAAARNDLAMGASGVDDATGILKAYMSMKGMYDQEAQQAAAIEQAKADQQYKKDSLAQDESQFQRTQDRMSEEAKALRAYNEAKDAQEAAYKDQGLEIDRSRVAIDRQQAATQRMAAQAAIEQNKISKGAALAEKQYQHDQKTEQNIQNMAKELPDDDYLSELQKAEEIMAKHPNDLPGVGLLDRQIGDDDPLLSQEGLQLRQSLRKLNLGFKHQVTGAAASPHEKEDIKAASGLDDMGSEKRIREGIAAARRMYDARQAKTKGAYDPEVVKEYERRRGVGSGQVNGWRQNFQGVK